MKKNSFFITVCFFYLIFILSAFHVNGETSFPQRGDTVRVNSLNKSAFSNRLNNPSLTINEGTEALSIAQKLNYKHGIAESNRVIGLGHYYLGDLVKAIGFYFTALEYYKKINDLNGEAKIYVNIGNLYNKDDFDEAIGFFNKALSISKRLNYIEVSAAVYNNIGLAYYFKYSFSSALSYYDKSENLYKEILDSSGLAQINLNRAEVYLKLSEYEKAEDCLLKVNKAAKQLDFNLFIANSDVLLANIYIAKKEYVKAEQIIVEGISYAQIVKNDKLLYDLEYTSYQLELKRKNFEKSIRYMKDIYRHDSVIYKQNSSLQTNLLREQFSQEEKNNENEKFLQQQRYDRTKFFGVLIVALLLLGLVGLLISNVIRKAKTNEELTELNTEVSRQKDNLDRINHHLTEIIEERTAQLASEKKKSDDLLYNILPYETAEELKQNGHSEARFYENVSVLFTDFKNFTETSEKLSSIQLIKELNICYEVFDSIVEKYQIEKIKTIGDAYLAVGGLPIANSTHAEQIIYAALEIRDYIEKRKPLSLAEFEIRIGIHTGPVVAGIVGAKKFAYDIWGDTVNTASRMETSCEPGKVNISQATYETIKDKFYCTYRGEVETKGKGKIKMYYVESIIKNLV